MLTLRNFWELERGEPPRVPVAPIEPHIARSIGAIHTRWVVLSQTSYLHIRSEHGDLTDDELLLMTDAVRRGLMILEIKRPGWAGICYQAANGRRYIAAIKAAQFGHEIFLRSFHRARYRQTRAMLKRGDILRTHK